MHIGNIIKQIRQSRSLSQQELADKSGLAQNVISRIEREAHKPTDDTTERLAIALDVEPDVFHMMAMLKESENSKLNNIKKEIAPLIRKELEEIYGLNN